MHESFVWVSPVGKLKICIQNELLKQVVLNSVESAGKPRTQLGRMVLQQFESFFRSAGNAFDLPVYPQGTEYQQKVWNCLNHIPPGETMTYGEIAAQLGSSARAVGNACRQNPIPIVVPCHRVIAASGLGGFAGQKGGTYAKIKRHLLQHEGVLIE